MSPDDNIKKPDKTALNPCIVTLTDPQSAISEEYRNIKSMIVKLTREETFHNTIIVTSTLSGEGKSVNAANLAVTMSHEFDHTVLLIDADLRNPVLHKYLGIKVEKGLADCLTEGIDVGEVLLRTGIEKLSFLPAGKSVMNPVELLSSKKMNNLIAEVKGRYPDRYIIIDTPPVMMFAETRFITAAIDGIIFVVREGMAPLYTIEDSLNLLGREKVLGILYNAVSRENLNGYHKYYYGQYDDYRKSLEKNDKE